MTVTIKAVGARKFDFLDDAGLTRKGISLFHIIDGDIERGEFGSVVNKVTLPFETLQQISILPFPCTLKLVSEQVLGSKGIYTKIVGVELVETIKRSNAN